MIRKVCVVITARASYSRIKTTLHAIQHHPMLELQIVLAGSSLLNKYGNIEDVIETDGFTVQEKIYTILDGENLTSMAKTVGISVGALANAFHSLQPHMVMVIADRFETIAISIAAAYQNIPLVHIQGGEITGSIDEKVRHANTKFADIHLVCNEQAKRTVIKLGEDPAYVFNTGCPSIDIAASVLKNNVLDFNPYERYGGTGRRPDYTNGYVIVMQHPVTTEFDAAIQQVNETIQAIKEVKMPVFWFSPNADAGTDTFSHSIAAHRNAEGMEHVHFFENMAPSDFLKLVYNSKCLVGNSSLGIRECSFMGIPVVNIGSRQSGRERAQNVLDVNHNKQAILNAIHYWQCRKRPIQSFIYGMGNAGERMAAVLARVPLRFSKTLQFQEDENTVHNTSQGGLQGSTRQEYKAA